MEIFQAAQLVLSILRSRNFPIKPIHSQGIYTQFPQPLTLAHRVVPSTIENQVSSVIKFNFPPFTNTLSATLASKVFYAFPTQTFSLQQGCYFQYKDESSSIFGVTYPLSTSTTSFPPSSVVS